MLATLHAQAAQDERLTESFSGQDSLATIHVENLRLRTFIGFNQEEIEKQQDIIINIEIRYLMSKHCQEDQVNSALNYKTITKEIIRFVEAGRFLLLEKLVADVLKISLQPEAVSYARVKIEKPGALRFADSVSITLDHQKT